MVLSGIVLSLIQRMKYGMVIENITFIIMYLGIYRHE